MINGITVVLYNRTASGTDDFNRTTYTETAEEVENVLVAPATATETLESINLTGKKAVYTLGIPKGDEHDWEDKKIEFFGQTWHSFGIPLEGIEDMIPLSWNKKVMVERYE